MGCWKDRSVGLIGVSMLTMVLFTADWPASETVSAKNDQAHMWEETWDDDDTAEDFSVQLR